MTFKTTLDRTAVIITSALTALFLIIIVGQFSFFKDYMMAGPLFSTIVMLVILFRGYSNRITNYRITEKEIIIQRTFSKIALRRGDIESATALQSDTIKGSLRVYGNGGFFGYYGQFTNKTLGKMTWCITQRDHLVLLRTIDGQNIIVSPDKPQQFIDMLNKRLQPTGSLLP